MMEQIENIIKFWFGRVEESIVPSKKRARIWFAEDAEVDTEIKSKFSDLVAKAAQDECKDWEEQSRGQLALILLLDQFSRHIYRNSAQAFAQDKQALRICLAGLAAEDDHNLSLIERVFYYFPLLHAEDLSMQTKSVEVYQQLADMALPETRTIYDSFFKFANHHYEIIQRFSRFPQRNEVLGRESTDEEIQYLKETEESE